VATDVVNRQRLAAIDERRVASIADATLGAIGRSGTNLTVAFVRDRFIRELNKKFRGSNQTTDVLSFPAEDDDQNAGGVNFIGAGATHIGDIVISTDTALRQANEAGHPFSREVDELVIHGVLHLCGYDHETDNGQMNRLELKLRSKLLDPT
jgi:probable rRNA maturation factor